MSETDTGIPPPPLPSVPSPERLEQAIKVIREILGHMGIAAVLDAKDTAEGGISIAVQLEGEAASAQPGRRSHVSDALQFLANKIVNRPGTERRWISLGIGGHPEPRSRTARPKKPAPATPLATVAPAVPRPSLPNGPAPGLPAVRLEEESAVEVSEDPALTLAVQQLARKASELGRFYAVGNMSRDDRARVLQAVREIAGLRVIAEGEGRLRRLVFNPEKPAPLPKKSLHDYDDEEG
jgi:predicted RNA-binding protein Jag